MTSGVVDFIYTAQTGNCLLLPETFPLVFSTSLIFTGCYILGVVTMVG
jgi:hypothetical protein